MKSIYNDVMKALKEEETKIAQKAFNVLDDERIAGIVEKDGVFWFEAYQSGNDCPQYIYEYLIKFIKRKFGIKYLSEIGKIGGARQ